MLLLQGIPAIAVFDYSARYQQAQNEIISLKLEKGRQLITLEKQGNPNNTLCVLAEDYIDFFTILINDNKAEYEKLLANKSARIKLIEKDDKKSPWYNYSKAEIYIHWATHRIRFGDYVKAATEIREAYKLLEENIKNHPNFLPNNKTMGMLETLVGTIPSNYQWVANIIGMEGSIDGGIEKIEKVINSTSKEVYMPQLRQEAIFIYTYLQMFVLKSPQKAWQLVEKHTKDYKTNLLNCYLRANIALKCKKTDVAIDVLKNRPTGKDYLNFYYLDYLMGQAKLYKGDDDAVNYFKRYVSFHPGQNFIKSSYIRLSWYYFLKNDLKNCNTYKLMVQKYGVENIEEDKRAQKEVKAGKVIDKVLLKSMLYFDGGYYTQAMALLNTKTENSYPLQADKLEYFYRKARVLHESGKTDEAIKMYEKTIELGKEAPEYYAANSCLMLGNVYEEKKWLNMACDKYRQCSKFPNKEYRNSIQQKAQAGLKRLKCN